MQINGIEFNAKLEDIIKELQNQLSINHIDLLQKTKNTSEDIMVQCPYHNNGHEKRPSAGIRKSDGQFHCFACGETHSLPEVISYCFGRTNDLIGSFGWDWLLKNFVSITVSERKEVSLNLSRDIPKEPIQPYILEAELDSYRYIHPYMYKRRLTNEIIELFDIGYDKKTECITFPVRDINGNCLFIARRSVNTKFFNYPPAAKKPLYGIYELKQVGWYDNPTELIICESMLDSLTCWVYGKYSVALNGLGDEYQFNQLRQLPCRKLILATDNDKAGMAARVKIKKAITNKLITQYILPEGKKDINELEENEFNNLKEIF